MLGIDPRLPAPRDRAAASRSRSRLRHTHDSPIFMIAVLFAYLLIRSWMPWIITRLGASRHTRAGHRYLMLVGFIVALALTVGSRIADEANSLAVRLPDLLKNREWIDKIRCSYWLEPARARMSGLQKRLQRGQDILPYGQELRRPV